jgi:transketolase
MMTIKITIDGSTSLTFTEDTSKKFEALGWQVLEIKDGDNDLAGIENALKSAKECTNKPTLIRVHTTIGCGSPKKQATESCHGAPLGKEELEATRKNLGWTFPPFEIPEQVLNHTQKALDRGKKAQEQWEELLKSYSKKFPQEYATFTQQISDRLPQGWSDNLPQFCHTDKPAATRVHSGACLNELARHFKGLFGGSADLSPSNVTLINNSGDFQKDAYQNQNIRFGVREHAMGAMCNGIALHGSGMIPFCASFLAFVDYMRNAIRMSALSQAGVIYIFTHDSVAVGEDGPTHQPVEHIASLRLIPNLAVIRPADGNETSGAYKVAIESRNRPTALIFTRQNVPHVDGTDADSVAKGGYILTDCEGTPDLILIATGSELHICVEAAKQLLAQGIKARLVSLPCWSIFEEQSKEYQQSVLPDSVPLRLAVEAGSPFGWSTFIGPHGDSISIKDFGHSAPGDTCMENRGYTVENVIARAKKLLKID